MQPAFVTIAFRGQDHRIYMSQGSTFEVLLEQLQAHVPQPLARHTLKLLLPHAKGSAGAPTSINVQQQAGTPMTAAGEGSLCAHIACVPVHAPLPQRSHYVMPHDGVCLRLLLQACGRACAVCCWAASAASCR
jgi:hypothetical protein